jgi:hypothetical protein
MIIRLVKTTEVEVDTDDIHEALEIVDQMDSEGALELIAEYFNAETDELLN